MSYPCTDPSKCTPPRSIIPNCWGVSEVKVVLNSRKIPFFEVLLNVVRDRQIGQVSNGGHIVSLQVVQIGTRKSPFLRKSLNLNIYSALKISTVAEVPAAERLCIKPVLHPSTCRLPALSPSWAVISATCETPVAPNA